MKQGGSVRVVNVAEAQAPNHAVMPIGRSRDFV